MVVMMNLFYCSKTWLFHANGIPVHPEGRQLAFVGDAMDRGPDSLKTLRFVIQNAGCRYPHLFPRKSLQ